MRLQTWHGRLNRMRTGAAWSCLKLQRIAIATFCSFSPFRIVVRCLSRLVLSVFRLVIRMCVSTRVGGTRTANHVLSEQIFTTNVNTNHI